MFPGEKSRGTSEGCSLSFHAVVSAHTKSRRYT
jgi:hypothetical protein